MTFLAGQPLTAADLNALETFAIPLMVVKTADESVTSSTTEQDDNELFLSVEADASYRLMMHLLVASTGTAGDIKFRFNAPTGSTISASSAGLELGATGVSGSMNGGAIQNVTSFPTSPSFGYAAVNSTIGVICVGTLTVGATAGTLKLQWGQNTSSATATTLKAGSSLELVRYA